MFKNTPVLINFRMIVFPNAKINIGLNIIARRADGYHDLETIFYPIKINDVLEVIEADELSFESSGMEIPGDVTITFVSKDTICSKKIFHHCRP